MLKLVLTKQYKKSLKKLSPKDKDLVKIVVDKLLKGQTLDPKYKDHELSGQLKGKRDCHIKPDLILIYNIDKNYLILCLIDVGNHSNLQLCSIQSSMKQYILEDKLLTEGVSTDNPYLKEDINESLNENIEKHDNLNPKLWNEDGTLKEEVHDKILEITNSFMEDLKQDGIKFYLKDIRLVGSNCSYNYTKDSDLDVHLIADSSSLNCPDDLYPLLYSSYRSIFNKNLDINFYGIPVEIYVEVNSEINPSSDIKSNGIYSVLNNYWIKEPVQTDIPDINQEEFDNLFTEWEDKYFDLLDANLSSEKIDDFIEDLYDLRKDSITKDGEYGLGNLVFKEFRNLGYLDSLKDLKNDYKGKELSLEALDNEYR